MIFGLHPVMEAINSGKEINKVLVKKGMRGEQADDLMHAIRKRGVAHQMVPQEKLQRITRKNHQGVIAFLSPVEYTHLDKLLPMVYESGEQPLFLILDHITDVRNFGAIARTAECTGVHGIIIPAKGGALVTADAVKTSAGALMKIPVCREENLEKTVTYLQESGVQVVGCTEKTEQQIYDIDFNVPVAIVMGAEDTGISSGVMRKAGHLAAIPMKGNINSLNVSVSAAVILYEAIRQRMS